MLKVLDWQWPINGAFYRQTSAMQGIASQTINKPLTKKGIQMNQTKNRKQSNLNKEKNGWKLGEDIFYDDEFPENLRSDKFSNAEKEFLFKMEGIEAIEND